MADYSQDGRRPEEKENLWVRYKNWVSSLNRGQRIRYRVLQAATVISVIIIVLFVAGGLWIREPEIPTPPPVDPVTPGSQSISSDRSDPSGTGEDDEHEGFDSAEELPPSQSGQREHVYTFLLAGRDTISGSTDVMILVTYDTDNKTVNAMSLPRDTMVNVSWTTKKLNTVYNYRKGSNRASYTETGMAALGQEVGRLTGIVPNFYVVVEWKAVGELVDALGGVTFNVPYDMNYDDTTPGQDLHIHQAKGERLLSGDDAMQIIRWRKNNGKYGDFSIGDTGRIKIQQDFLTAVAKELLQPKNILKIPELAEIFTQNVATNLPLGNLIWLAQQAIGMDAEQDIHFFTMPYDLYNRYTSYTNFTSYVLPKAEELLEMVNEHMNPYNRDIRLSDLEMLVKKSDGSFYLTNGGKLADDRLARAGYRRSDYAPPSTTTNPPAETEQPPETEDPADPVQTDPNPTNPNQTDPNPTQTDPNPTQTDPNPTQTDPDPTDPAPAGPDPADPGTPSENDPPPAQPDPGDETPSGSGEESESTPEPVSSEPASASNDPQGQAGQNGVLPAWPSPVQ